MSTGNIQSKVHSLEWDKVASDLNEHGYAILRGVLSDSECTHLISLYSKNENFRATIDMKRYNFGKGEYKYFKYPLPEIIQYLRSELYPPLCKVANEWSAKLNMQKKFPASHAGLLKECTEHGQARSTPLILKYEEGDFNTLHQDLYGDVYFPFQLVLFLTQPGVDYTGGEFVLIEQRPRLQSKAIVLQQQKGDIVVFSTNYRAAKGTKGYYRASMRHGVSKLHSGNRYNAGIIFHDAK